MLKHLAWMGASTFARVGSGVLVFIVIARALGPDGFGHYMFWFSATYLLSLVANFGLGNLLLREIGQDVSRLPSLIAQALKARLLISFLLIALAGVAAPFVEMPILMLTLLVASLLEMLAETFFVAYRAKSLYSMETRWVTAVAVMQLFAVSVAALISPSENSMAIAYCLTRLVQFSVVYIGLHNTLGNLQKASLMEGLLLLKRSKSYAIDFGLGNLFGHIDSLILRAYVGVGAVGLYQAGMRVFQGGAQMAPILANVFLPSVARVASDKAVAQRSAEKVQLAFLACGISFGLVLTYGAELIVSLLFGSGYAELATLLPLFGILFFVRFFAASWGLILTAHGYQQFRAISTSLHLALALLLAALLVSEHGVAGWLWSVITANFFLALIYMLGAVRNKVMNVSTKVSATAVFGCVAFLPQLSGAWSF